MVGAAAWLLWIGLLLNDGKATDSWQRGCCPAGKDGQPAGADVPDGWSAVAVRAGRPAVPRERRLESHYIPCC